MEQLLTSLRERGVQFWLDGDRVRYKTAADVLTPDVLAELRQHKAEIIECLRQTKPSTTLVIRRNGTATSRRTMSFAQERLWFLDRLDPNTPAYNIPLAQRLSGHLNVPALQRSLTEIVRRHESLRTSFGAADGRPVQTIMPAGEFDLPVDDLAGVPAEQRESEGLLRAEEDAQRPFDLTRDCLLRAKLYRLEPTEYVLMLNLHHIAADGWSLTVLFRELGEIYDAFVAPLGAGQAPLPELPIQYADFAEWQRDWLSGDVLKQQLEYWRQRLADAPVVLDLPTDRPRPPVQTAHGRTMIETYPRALADVVQEFSRHEGVSPFMTLLAAFQILLHRYSRQDDILVGTPMACRNRTEIEALIGLFVNTAVMRSNLSGNPTFRALLGQVREVTLEALSHQELPFEKLVEELQPERNLAHAPLFQVMFIAGTNETVPARLTGLTSTPLHISSRTSKYDLSLYWELTDHGLVASWEYNTDLFEVATIRRMSGHYRTLLEGLVARPDDRIEALPLLTAAEREQVVVDWNSTERGYPRHACIHELFEAQVQRTPDAIAAEFGPEHLTYRQLNDRADRLAQHLRGNGVGPGRLVGVYLERSLDMIVGLLGILKAGGAYLPLDPNFPADRLAFMIEDARPALLLTQKKLRDSLPPHKSQVLSVDDLPANASASVTTQKPTATDVAYVLFTSGSTGRPKGIQIPHRGMVNFLVSFQREPGLTAKDVVMAVTTLSFDIAGLEIFLPLITGARVVVVSREIAADGAQLAKVLKKSQATVLQATPVTWRMLLAAGWTGLPGLKMLVGGEALPVELAEQLLKCGAELWNLYGPTETTVWSSISRVLPGQPIRIGRPIANMEFYVVDQQLQPLPVGVPGELLIGGDGMGLGYLNRPELTAEKFVAHPFRPGMRAYRTGDLCRFHTDGAIEFLGRLDHQVKIRGFRIELGEIEAALGEHPEVRQAVVVAREDTPGEKRLAAYVQLKNGHDVPAGDFRAFLRNRLPDYMVPAAFVRLPKWPLTPSGKVDRKLLPAPEDSAMEAGSQFVAPRDELEQTLARLWEEIFQRKPIGARDNFFDLGGHSLLAVRLFAQVEKLTGKNLPLVTLFQAPTIEQLAGVLREQGWEAPWSSLVPIKAGGSRPPFYCVHGIGGNILEYLDLAKYMDADQPFYGIQAVGLDGKRPWLKTVEEQATHHIGEIRAFQPEGPYYLGGSSYGGVVAYEMAQQLHRAGERVALLAFFDTAGPGYPEYLTAGRRWNHFLYRVGLHWGNFRASTGRQKLDYLYEKAKRFGLRLVWYAKRFRYRFQKRVEQLTLPKAIVQTRKASETAVSRYNYQPYPGHAVLFRATNQPRGIHPNPTLGWGPYVLGGLEIYDTPGHHGAIVREPRSRVLAQQLEDCLRRIHTEVKPDMVETR